MAPSTPATKVKPPTRPTMIFDGDCGFCRRWIHRWNVWTKDSVAYAPYQEVASSFKEIPRQSFAEAVHFVDRDGLVSAGAEAVVDALGAGGIAWPRWIYRLAPAVFEFAYRQVAQNRMLFSRLTRWGWGDAPLDPETSSRNVLPWFATGLGLTYLVAFGSLWGQAAGLFGPDGILPATFFDQSLSLSTYIQYPALFWLTGFSNTTLNVCFGVGVAASFWLTIARLYPAPAALIAWICYYSLTTAGQTFLSFQWDSLLLEAGFLGLLILPWGRRYFEPGILVWLPRILLFRLVFFSGWVKLASGDPSWSDGSAMTFHFWTQPIPNPLALWLSGLPSELLRLSGLGVIAIELVIPLFYFAPPRLRRWAAKATLLLQLVIAVTGNYGFFNLLTAVLCLFLYSDRELPRFPLSIQTKNSQLRFRTITAGVWFACILLGLNLLSTWRVWNSYGLFAVMTKSRPEISIEGSNDGKIWKTYRFKYKPNHPEDRPPFIPLFMPRLDWQMWFAALGPHRRSMWLTLLERRLLEGSPQVVGLLESNPFPDAPPKWVRTRIRSFVPSKDPSYWWQVGQPKPFGPVRRGL
jgi:predicted DCC family thiol-disulfide oxidoreductase YuxK